MQKVSISIAGIAPVPSFPGASVPAKSAEATGSAATAAMTWDALDARAVTVG